MKKSLLTLKLVLTALCLAANFACGLTNQNNNNLTNVSADNANTVANIATTVANAPANSAPTPPVKNPREVCAYLPEFSGGEYKSFGLDKADYKCKFEQREKLAGGKFRSWDYEVYGTSSYVKWVEFRLASNGTTAENLAAEKRFVGQMETFWQKAFAAPLPDKIKDELLFNKGKPANSKVEFNDPLKIEVRHVDAGNNIYGLNIRFVFYQIKNGNPSPKY